MKLSALLFALVLLPIQPNIAHAQTSSFSAADVTVVRSADGTGWDITLSPEAAKRTAIDQLWLVIDGKSEGFSGGYYNSFTAGKSIRYNGNVSSELDGNVKDILKGQGLPIKAGSTTFLVTFGVNNPDSGHVSKTLHFRHENNNLIYTQFPSKATYKVGDKIPIFEAVALDSGITMRDAFAADDTNSTKFAHLPNDLLHRITIQVQFVPKTPGTP